MSYLRRSSSSSRRRDKGRPSSPGEPAFGQGPALSKGSSPSSSPSKDVARRKRIKAGLCPEPDCGIRTHKMVPFGKPRPLTTDQVHNGRCLKCMPFALGRLESPRKPGGAEPGNRKVTETSNEDGTVTRTTKTFHPDGRVTAAVTTMPGPAETSKPPPPSRSAWVPRGPEPDKPPPSRGSRKSVSEKTRSTAPCPKLHSVEEEMEVLSVGTASTASMTLASLSTAGSKSLSSAESRKPGAGGAPLPPVRESSFGEVSVASSVGTALTAPTFLSAQSQLDSEWRLRNIGGMSELEGVGGHEYFSSLGADLKQRDLEQRLEQEKIERNIFEGKDAGSEKHLPSMDDLEQRAPHLKAPGAVLGALMDSGADAEAITHAAEMLLQDNATSASCDATLYFLTALLILSRKDDKNKRTIVLADDAFAAITEAMQKHMDGSVQVQRSACKLIGSLCPHPGNSKHVAQMSGCEAVLDAMSVHAGDGVLQEDALACVKALSLDAVARSALLSLGAPEAVTRAMRTHAGNPAVQSEGCRTLGNLLAAEDAGRSVARVNGDDETVDAVLGAILAHPNATEVHKAACVALSCLSSSEANVELIRNNGMLRKSLELAYEQSPGEVGCDVQMLFERLNMEGFCRERHRSPVPEPAPSLITPAVVPQDDEGGRENQTTLTRYLFLGRDGVGKESIMDSLAKDVRHNSENCDIYLDAPGLEIREGRDEAAREIHEKLRADDFGTGCLPKLVFVVALEDDGHVNPADGVLMDLILGALPDGEEAVSYGIIVNNVTKWMRDKFNEDLSAWDVVRACLNEGRRHPTAYIHLREHAEPLHQGPSLPLAELQAQFGEVLKGLQDHSHGWVFNSPVDPVALGLPDYFDVIEKPMDLGTVKERLDDGAYGSLQEVAGDVNLTFDNAMLYNPEGGVVWNMARELKDKFVKDCDALRNAASVHVNENGRQGSLSSLRRFLDILPFNCVKPDEVGDIDSASYEHLMRRTQASFQELKSDAAKRRGKLHTDMAKLRKQIAKMKEEQNRQLRKRKVNLDSAAPRYPCPEKLRPSSPGPRTPILPGVGKTEIPTEPSKVPWKLAMAKARPLPSHYPLVPQTTCCLYLRGDGQKTSHGGMSLLSVEEVTQRISRACNKQGIDGYWDDDWPSAKLKLRDGVEILLRLHLVDVESRIIIGGSLTGVRSVCLPPQKSANCHPKALIIEAQREEGCSLSFHHAWSKLFNAMTSMKKDASSESSPDVLTRYLFLGRNGIGKESIIESLAKGPHHERDNRDIHLNIPGLDMDNSRDEAAEAMSEMLRGRGKLGTDCDQKLVFVVTLGKDGHVNPADGALMELVLDALPNGEEAVSYGIIVNNVTKEMRDKFNRDLSVWDAVMACLNEGHRQPTAYIHLRNADSVDEKGDGCQGSLLSLRRFLDILPSNCLKPDEVGDIHAASYESLIRRNEEAFWELRYDATKRREKLQTDTAKLRKQLAKIREQQNEQFRKSRKRKFDASSSTPRNPRSERPKPDSAEPRAPILPGVGKTAIPAKPSSIPWKLAMAKASLLPPHYPLVPQITCCLYLRGDGQNTLAPNAPLPSVEDITLKISQVCNNLGIDGHWDDNWPTAKLRQKDGVEMLLRMHLVPVENQIIIGGVRTGVSSVCLPSQKPTEYHPKALIIEAQRERGCSLSFHETWCKIFDAVTSSETSTRSIGNPSAPTQDAITAALSAPPQPQPSGTQYIIAINKYNERRYFAGGLDMQSRRAAEIYFEHHGWTISDNLTCGEGMVCHWLTNDIIEGGYALWSEG